MSVVALKARNTGRINITQTHKSFVPILMRKTVNRTNGVTVGCKMCECVRATTPGSLLSPHLCAMLKSQQQMAMKGLYI